MKKIFWCSVAVAVAAASSVYLASRHVEEYSFKTVGHAIAALGSEESASNSGESAPVPEPIPATGLPVVTPSAPEAMAPDAGTAQVVARLDGAAQGQITIDESNPISDFAISSPSTLPKIGETVQSFPVPPSKMPYCQDDTEVSQVHMPYADDEDTGEEEAEVWGLLRQAAREATEETTRTPEKLPLAPKEINEQEKVEEEQQQSGANRMDQCPSQYHHEQVCPYSGHSCPLPQVCPSAPETPVKKKEPMDAGEEQEPPHRNLDTMEFRPSDAGFQHFVPGPF